jgi:HK97 family phage portal protein
MISWAGADGMSGPPVSERSAMTVSAVYRCAALLAGLTAGTPLKIYQDVPGQGRQEAPDHRLADLFSRVPMPGKAMTAFTWREMWSLNTSLWGNHYSAIRYDNAARVVGFEAAYPWAVEIIPQGSRLLYVITWANGRREPLDQEDVLHIPGLGFDGIRGLSKIQAFARPAVALAKTLEEAVARTHDNAVAGSSLIELPPGITPEGKRKLEAYWNENAVGRLNRGKPLFVDKDTKYTPLTMSQEDLNTLEFRRFQLVDICRFFGVPPHLIGEAANTSAWGSGIEQLTIGFLRFTLEAEFQRIESEINAKLFNGGPFYVLFDRDSLLAMDAKTAAEVASIEIGNGSMLINERRRRLHRPDVEGGDKPLINSTMIPLDRALSPPAPAAAPPPAKDTANATAA